MLALVDNESSIEISVLNTQESILKKILAHEFVNDNYNYLP